MYRFLAVVTFLCIATTDLANAQAGSWKSVAPMPTARSGVAATYHDGYIYVVGGTSATGAILDTVERYDVDANTWETLDEPLRRPRKNAAMIVYDEELLVVGGRDHEGNVLNSAEIFDPDDAGDGWRSFSQMEERREGARLAHVGGVLHVLGGSDEQGAILQSVELYDVDGDEWELDELWTLEAARAAFSTAIIADSVYVLGGFDTFGPVMPVERYSEAEGTAIVANLGQARGNLAAATKGDSIVVVGGRTSTNQVVSTVSFFVPGTNAQPTGPALLEARERHALVSVGDRVYAIGGTDPFGNTLASVELLDLTRGVGLEAGPTDAGEFAVALYPNPASDDVVIEHAWLEGSTALTAEVVDILGRRVATLASGSRIGEKLRWDLRDGTGRPVPSGLYLVCLTRGSERVVRQFAVIR